MMIKSAHCREDDPRNQTILIWINSTLTSARASNGKRQYRNSSFMLGDGKGALLDVFVGAAWTVYQTSTLGRRDWIMDVG
jgi:hypothetical protein